MANNTTQQQKTNRRIGALQMHFSHFVTRFGDVSGCCQLPVIALRRHSFWGSAEGTTSALTSASTSASASTSVATAAPISRWLDLWAWAKPFFYFRSVLFGIQRDGSEPFLSGCCNRKHKSFGQNAIGAQKKGSQRWKSFMWACELLNLENIEALVPLYSISRYNVNSIRLNLNIFKRIFYKVVFCDKAEKYHILLFF